MNLIEQWAARWNVPRAAIDELAKLYTPPFDSIPGGSEAYTQQHVRITAPKLGASLWRNNSGATLDESGRLVRYGLANDSKKINEVFKSSDLIGITPIMWQGRRFGVFTAIEVKRPDWTKPENDRDRAQANFLTTVEALGGIGQFVTSAAQYEARVKAQ